MKYSFLIFIVLFINLSFNSFAQNNFPKSWTGNYKGDLSVYEVDSVKMKIKMEIQIAKTDNDSIYKWNIIYDFKGKRDIRAYKLIVVDPAKGIYKIDEKNSIVIDAYLSNNNVFTSFFKVSGSFIIATYTKEEDILNFEIISAKSVPVSITGNTKQGEEEIPEVSSFPVNGRQKAVLFKY